MVVDRRGLGPHELVVSSARNTLEITVRLSGPRARPWPVSSPTRRRRMPHGDGGRSSGRVEGR